MKAVHLLSDVLHSLRELFFRFSNCTLNIVLHCHQYWGKKALKALYFFLMIRLSMRPLKHSLESSGTQKMRGKIIGQNEISVENTFGRCHPATPLIHNKDISGHQGSLVLSYYAFSSPNNHFGFHVIICRFLKSGRSSSECVLLLVAVK